MQLSQSKPQLSHEDFLSARAIRRYLHEYPELSAKEYATTNFIRAELDKAAIRILDLPLETGLVAEIGKQDAQPVIALRADIDALPINEQTNLPYASKHTGVMHACGHDFHTSSLLAAAKLLKTVEHTLTGRIRFLFQPAEEINRGAKAMLTAGALQGVSAIVGIHNKPDLPVGAIGIKSGVLMAAVDQFKIVIQGKGTHAALPHQGNDPIVTAAQMVTAFQNVVSRFVPSEEQAVLSVTSIQGGNTWNVIPDTVTLEGTIRTFDEAVQRTIKQYMEEIVNHYPKAFSQTAEIFWIPSPPAVNNDPQLTTLLCKKIADFAQVIDVKATLGGEDFAYYSKECPACFAFIGSAGPEEWHHPKFSVSDEGLKTAIEFYITAGLTLLEHNHNIATQTESTY